MKRRLLVTDIPRGAAVFKKGLGWEGEVVSVNKNSGWLKISWSTGPFAGSLPMICDAQEIEVIPS